ncbi:MAG: glycosyltransferase [Candidatus Ancillula sp.]|jgi:GT2 family glycosyltransferase|nr:glycosyltransferase [Candidatus Ancillula sp.]
MKVAIVIVTYKRQEMLQNLLKSICDLSVLPDNVYVIDNENSAENKNITENCKSEINITYFPMQTNTGGAGGFAKGVELAFQSDSDWFWLMDDDVELYKNSLEEVKPILNWAEKNDHRCIQPKRHNGNGDDFYWQYKQFPKLGISDPFANMKFTENEKYKLMNAACFEGGFFSKSLVKEIGFPDSRFFIAMDDTTYGYLASKKTQSIYIANYLFKRARTVDNIKLSKGRQFNTVSNMTRYYYLRNRGYYRQYLKKNNDYNPFLYGVGTFYTIAKETVRALIGKQLISGTKQVFKGWKDSRKIL